MGAFGFHQRKDLAAAERNGIETTLASPDLNAGGSDLPSRFRRKLEVFAAPARAQFFLAIRVSIGTGTVSFELNILTTV
jgi:hypothetical protein